MKLCRETPRRILSMTKQNTVQSEEIFEHQAYICKMIIGLFFSPGKKICQCFLFLRLPPFVFWVILKTSLIFIHFEKQIHSDQALIFSLCTRLHSFSCCLGIESDEMAKSNGIALKKNIKDKLVNQKRKQEKNIPNPTLKNLLLMSFHFKKENKCWVHILSYRKTALPSSYKNSQIRRLRLYWPLNMKAQIQH